MPGQLASELTNFSLPFQPHQRSKTLLYGLALGLQSACAQRIPHQLVVDYDIRSHDVYVYSTSYTLHIVSVVVRVARRSSIGAAEYTSAQSLDPAAFRSLLKNRHTAR